MAQRELRIVVMGAGMAGLLAAIKLRQENYRDFVVYEKAATVGGTWRENTYPGLTCDVPSHHYTYKFERNPDWSRQLPPGPEIQDYFERTCDAYDVRRCIRFGCEVLTAEYRGGRWQLELGDGTTDAADVLIAATGVLHRPSIPKIPGMETFAGQLFHSARWDHSVSLEPMRVGVIGGGSTGVQITSALAGKVAHYTHFQRTPQWIMPVTNGYYSDAEKAAFRADPALLEEAMDTATYTRNVEAYTQVITGDDTEGARYWGEACLRNLEDNVLDVQLREKLRPDHQALCKRLIFSPDYYEAIQRGRTSLETTPIASIEPKGIRTEDECLHELDLIVLATGFQPDQFMRPMVIKGDGGITLEDFWRERPKAYLAISMPGFPNLFMLNGPNGPVGNFSLIDIAEHQWNYIRQLLAALRSGERERICPSAAALEAFERDRVAAAKKTIWYTGGCRSWYLDAQGIPASWPWNYSRFVEQMSAPHWPAFAGQ
ncbi:MAG: NAD(P)/FAD-dependent oxidoreductase [Pseudomonadota bacterium]